MLTYPLEPIGPAAAGGSEQIAHLLRAGLAGRSPKGGAAPIELEWFGGGRGTVGAGALNAAALRRLEERYNRSVIDWLGRRAPFDLIHIHGGPFYRMASAVATPILLTLHLSAALYEPPVRATATNLHLQCVSRTQFRAWRAAAGPSRLAPSPAPSRLVGWIGNGIDLACFRPRRRPRPRAPLLFLGRICREKGAHLAIELARRLRRRLWLAGAVYPLAAHRDYFRRRIAPHLGPGVRWIERPRPQLKRALLAHCAAVVIPSLVEETSSLVAMEAAACGVPVLALRRGALPEIVEHGQTGWIADSVEELAEAASRLEAIDTGRCRERAERRFCARRMCAEYARLYRRLAA